MTRKRTKLLAATVAAGLLSGTVVQIPYNALAVFPVLPVEVKGGVASAALPPEAQAVLDVFDAIKSKMTSDERTAVGNTRAALTNLNDVTLLNPIWDGIEAKLATVDAKDYPLVKKENLLALIKDFHFFYVSNDLTLEQMWLKHRPLIDQLAKLGGVTGGLQEIDFGDFTEFYVAVVNEAKNQFSSPARIAELLVSRGGVSGVIDACLEAALNNNSLMFSKVFTNLGITGAELIQVKNAMGAIVDPDQKARDALAMGYLRSQTVFSKQVSTDGRVVTPKLTVLDKEIPNDVLTWTVKSGSNVTYDANRKAFVLASTVTTAKVTIEAKTLFIVKMLYEGELELTAVTSNPPPSGSPGSFLPLPPLHSNFDAGITNIRTRISNIIGAIPAGATPEQIREAQIDAKRLVERELKKLAVVDVKAFVREQNGTKTLNLTNADITEIKKHMAKVKAQADELNALLLSADPSAQPAEIEFSLDFGTGDNFEMVIPIGLIQEARTVGIDRIGGIFNGMNVTIHADEPVTDDVTVQLRRLAPNAVTSATSFPIGSDVYELELFENGEQLESFEHPVTLRLPATNINGLDVERLVVAKVVNNGLQVFTSYYDEDGNLVEVERDTLSTYVVIENKVEFDDVASVSAWAGRAIDVTAAQGIFEGRPGSKFDPNANITRAEFAKVLVDLFQLGDAEATESFSDVSTSDWFHSYVAAAAKAGVIQGRSASIFDPNAPVSRAEMAAMAARALVAAGEAPSVSDAAAYVSKFTDADQVLPGLEEGIAVMVREGFMQGVPGGAFQPNDYATRAQAAVMMYRIWQSR